MKRIKKRKSKKRCFICGELIGEKGMKVMIEEAKVIVCQECGMHAKKD